jgi:crossover junction endodeoxyribonuclease RuvC
LDQYPGRLETVRFGTVSAGRTRKMPAALRLIYERLEEIISETRPDAVAIESVFYAKNVRSALTLGHARGVCILAAAVRGISLFEYSPLEVKQAVVGYGRAEKIQVQQMVRRLLGLAEPPSPPDAADALAVAICHAHTISTTDKLARARA